MDHSEPMNEKLHRRAQRSSKKSSSSTKRRSSGRMRTVTVTDGGVLSALEASAASQGEVIASLQSKVEAGGTNVTIVVLLSSPTASATASTSQVSILPSATATATAIASSEIPSTSTDASAFPSATSSSASSFASIATSLVGPSPGSPLSGVTHSSSSHPLSHGDIAGISIGSIIGSLLLLILAVVIYRRRTRNRERDEALDMMRPDAGDPYPGMGTSTLGPISSIGTMGGLDLETDLSREEEEGPGPMMAER